MADSCLLDFDKIIKGEAKRLAGLSGVEVRSFEWGLSHSNRGLAPTKTGRSDVKDFIFRHYIDTAAPVLMQYCAQALPINKASLRMFRQGGVGGPQQYMEITLNNVRVLIADTIYLPGYLLPEQEVRLSFSKAEFWYSPQSDKGGDGSGKTTFTWNAEATA